MKKSPYKSTDLVCLDCGSVVTINRKLNRQKNVGHIKDMYCPYCNKEVKFFEVKDVSIFKWDCLTKNSLTEEEFLVMSLLEKREEKNEQSECRIYKKILDRK